MRGYSPLLPLISCILLLMSINYQSYFSKSLCSRIPVTDHSQEGLFLNIIISGIIFNLLWCENQGQHEIWYKVRDCLLWWVSGDENEGLNQLFFFFGEFLIPKVWEILINFFEYIFFLRIVNYFDQMKSSLILFPSSKGPRAKHFLEKSKYIKQIAPNGASGIFSGPFRLIFEIYSCQTSRFKLGNWITMVTSLPYQNPQYIKMQKQRKQK